MLHVCYVTDAQLVALGVGPVPHLVRAHHTTARMAIFMITKHDHVDVS
jgi:hypothetical protein